MAANSKGNMALHISELEVCIEAIASLERKLLHHQTEVEKLKESIEFFRKKKETVALQLYDREIAQILIGHQHTQDPFPANTKNGEE